MVISLATIAGLIADVTACLVRAQQIIPQELWSNTPVFLRATGLSPVVMYLSTHHEANCVWYSTAGMRVLQANNASAADLVLAAITTAIDQSEFDAAASSALILSGQAEGAYGWVTANYVLGTLSDVVRAVRRGTSLRSLHTYGALDLGGASTQVGLAGLSARVSSPLVHSWRLCPPAGQILHLLISSM